MKNLEMVNKFRLSGIIILGFLFIQCKVKTNSKGNLCAGVTIYQTKMSSKQMNDIRIFLDSSFTRQMKLNDLCFFPMTIQMYNGVNFGSYKVVYLYAHIDPFLILKHYDDSLYIIPITKNNLSGINLYQSEMDAYIKKHEKFLTRRKMSKLKKELEMFSETGFNSNQQR